MPVLNQEILGEIAKKVIIDGDQSRIYAFGLSGKPCWKALKDAFISINFLELDKDAFKVGWDNNQASYEKLFVESLMNCIGYSIKKLVLWSDKPYTTLEISLVVSPETKRRRGRKRGNNEEIIHSDICEATYSKIIKTIILVKKLTTFKSGYNYNENANRIILHLRKTIKHLTLGCFFYDLKELDLESFEYLDNISNFTEINNNFPKADALTISLPVHRIKDAFKNDIENSLFHSVKTLTLKITNLHDNYSTDFLYLQNIKKSFPFITDLIIYYPITLTNDLQSLTNFDQFFLFLSENKIFKIKAKIDVVDNSQEPIDAKWLEGFQSNTSNPNWNFHSGIISYDNSEVNVKWRIPKSKDLQV